MNNTSGFFSADEKAPDFIAWLKGRYGYTPQYFYQLCVRTGPASDYYKAMEWYRRRYRYEMDLRRQLIDSNPFIL